MRGFKYILFTLALIASANVWGQYNPANPAEPGAPVNQHTLTLQADPPGGGSFNLNATTTQNAGATISLRAYTASNFTFVSWEEDGTVISTTANFNYTMPDRDVTLIAHYNYTPSNPAEPSEPNIPAKPVYSNLYLTANPSAGGSFNIASGNSYQVGNSVRVQAYPASNFTFMNWTLNGEVISTSNIFDYVMLEGIDANHLVANFSYTPGSPSEPSVPVFNRRVYLMADPEAGGYFNVSSGNEYAEGSQQTFRAYNNQWYTFQNWTIDGEIVSTNSVYTMTIPNHDVTLVAHYSYEYNPGNPNEPGQSTTKHLSIYGMTANGMLEQKVHYPVFLENTEDVYGVTVVIHFPEGFQPIPSNAVPAERAAGHTLTVEPYESGNNAFRFDLTGTTPLTGQNGKIFEVPVAIGKELMTGQSYQVVLTNAARLNLDGSKDVINTRDGYIYVEEQKEDGLYAQFSYEKLQSRVKFNNLSSDKALSYFWEFGDDTFSTEQSPLHVYAHSGYYDVRLTVQGQTGSDVAMMTVLINDETSWRVNGSFFLDTEVLTVRHFTSSEDLFTFLSARPIDSNLQLTVKAGETFNYALTDENIARLTSLQTALADGGYMLTVQKGTGTGEAVLSFGNDGDHIESNVVELFTALGQSILCDDVTIKLWGITFNPSKLSTIEGQTILAGETTAVVDFAPISTDLTFTWTASADSDALSGFTEQGTGNIPAMTIASTSNEECHLTYHIAASYQGRPFTNLTHVITVKPSLEGSFTNLKPEDGATLKSTTVTLQWNSIRNAVYDVYLWNAANQRPATPVAEGITELSYTSQNFCQNEKSYKWQVVARNGEQQLASDTMHFSVHVLPDLHVIAVRAIGEDPQEPSYLEAARTITVEWTVRNDGEGDTGEQSWTDRVWLVPDVYGGTSQNNCKLMATVQNVRSLQAGGQYTNQAQFTVEESQYGSYYLLVASDMSSVTQIEWSSVGGSIVNPYEPVVGGSADQGTYPYIFAKTTASGNKLVEEGETTTRSDNFFYTKVDISMPTMNDEDWALLEQVYQQKGNGAGWKKTWDFNVERHTTLTLPGVSILNGHVVSVDLPDNGLTGDFPFDLLTLPALRSLNLRANGLSGDVAAGMAAFLSAGGDLQSPITTLNIANNQLEGNIGAFVQSLTALTTLYASGNRFDEVNPMIPTKVTTLTLGGQTIDCTVDLDFLAGNVSPATLLAQLPSIVRYNHRQHKFVDNVTLVCSAANDWQARLAITSESITFSNEGSQNAFYGESGSLIGLSSLTPLEDCTFNLRFAFPQGDANFNGDVNVTDLQAQINFAFEDYNDKPFNFTAANLWIDDVINVQDVVKMADLLLNAGGSPHTAYNTAPRSAGSGSADATLFVSGRQLWIETDTPVAAFEVTLSSDDAISVSNDLEQMGFTCVTRNHGDITRLVGYSMSKATIPAGTTSIAQLSQSGVRVLNAVLADTQAEEIPVSFTTTVATAIDTAPCDEILSHQNIFDLQGRQISNNSSPLKKGVYIVNGKKVFIK